MTELLKYEHVLGMILRGRRNPCLHHNVVYSSHSSMNPLLTSKDSIQAPA